MARSSEFDEQWMAQDQRPTNCTTFGDRRLAYPPPLDDDSESNNCVHYRSTGITGLEVEFMPEQHNGLQRLGRYAGIAVVLSIAACYGTLALVAILALAGITISIHEGAWAGVIVALVWIAVIAMGVNIQRYRSFGPFILSDIGALLVSWVMLVDYSRTMESAGFVMLLTAAFWDRHLKKKIPEALPNADQESG
jgi:hypothetical protein